MGINQLNKIIKRFAPNAISEKDIQHYKYKKIAIDSSILLYKYRYAAQHSTDSHIHGFIQRVCYYLKHGILPVFVFDGIPPSEKKITLDKRIKQKNKVEDKIQTLIDQKLTLTKTDLENALHEDINQEIDKLSKQVTYVTKSHRLECKYLLNLLGIPVIEANGEAENTCASLQKSGIVDYMYTEDTDALTFGSPYMLKSARKLEKLIEINLEKILKGLNFTMDQFIDFCILCGCDYCSTIPKVGPITALNLIKEYSTIENILENIKDKYTIPDNFDFDTARRLFKHDPTKDIKYDLKVNNIKSLKLKEFLMVEMKLNENLYNSIIKKYNKSLIDYNKHMSVNRTTTISPKQTKIINFFSQSSSESESKNKDSLIGATT